MDKLMFHTVDELRQLSMDELRALWELVPTERQRSYRAAYEREIRNVGSDALEKHVNDELLRRYIETGLVPLGTRWARTPTRVQDAARNGDTLETSEIPAPAHRGKVALVFFAAMLVFTLFAVTRLGRSSEVAAVSTPTPTPAVSPTPTPLALEDQDSVIQEGDAGREIAYPVSLKVSNGDDAPRVWVVQQRKVGASEWKYEPNPDTASFIYGLMVRPVIGIPWDTDNAALLEAMGENTTFTLTMNTGAMLTFKFASKNQIRRSDTGIFRQVGPGLVLVLIGETDADGMPTATRTLVTALYSPEQELAREGELINLPALSAPAPTLEPVLSPTPADPFTHAHVELISATYTENTLTTRLRIYNSGIEPLHITPDDITLTSGYSPNPIGAKVPAEGLQPFDLLPEQVVDLTLVWSWNGEPYGSLAVGGYVFAVQSGY